MNPFRPTKERLNTVGVKSKVCKYGKVDPVHPPTLALAIFIRIFRPSICRRGINFFYPSTNNYSKYFGFKNHGWSPELPSSPPETKLFTETIGQTLCMPTTRGSVSE